jgi:glutamine phosphoribosylpyrophosphate amidotransferase
MDCYIAYVNEDELSIAIPPPPPAAVCEYLYCSTNDGKIKRATVENIKHRIPGLALDIRINVNADVALAVPIVLVVAPFITRMVNKIA